SWFFTRNSALATLLSHYFTRKLALLLIISNHSYTSHDHMRYAARVANRRIEGSFIYHFFWIKDNQICNVVLFYQPITFQTECLGGQIAALMHGRFETEQAGLATVSAQDARISAESARMRPGAEQSIRACVHIGKSHYLLHYLFGLAKGD